VVLVSDVHGQTETRTFTCVHCNAIVEVPHKAPPDKCGGFCGRCFAPICTTCAMKGRCTPFERRIEQAEARDRSLRSMGIA
jgi:hypothetical protein